MNEQDSNMAANAVSHAAWQASNAIQQTVAVYGNPSVVYRPRIYPDGDHWCALLGDNIQEGVCGFGKSPSAAMEAFDKAWHTDFGAKA